MNKTVTGNFLINLLLIVLFLWTLYSIQLA